MPLGVFFVEMPFVKLPSGKFRKHRRLPVRGEPRRRSEVITGREAKGGIS